jgi:nitroimidazol reductase NimA-like FMN-containing flavoprotein (pyridoxamine 5'-phosphate oxidase superfamily)
LSIPVPQLLELDREECIRLLATKNLGRLAVNVAGWAPVICPVNYAFDQSSQSVVFRSDRGGKLTALALSGQAAFEIDDLDPSGRSGWSVIVIGRAEEVTEPAEAARLEQLGLCSLAPGAEPRWIRIRSTVISGRRIRSTG